MTVQTEYRYSLPDITKPVGEPVEAEASEPIPLAGWELIREVTRCTGHCCRAFTLASPVELGQMVIKQRHHQAGEVVEGDPITPENADWIATALIYLGEHDESSSGLNNITKPPAPPGHRYTVKTKPKHWYACRHLDGDRCAIYDARPDVCRNYPYKGNECHNPGCTRRTIMAGGLSWWRAGEPADLTKALEEDL